MLALQQRFKSDLQIGNVVQGAEEITHATISHQTSTLANPFDQELFRVILTGVMGMLVEDQTVSSSRFLSSVVAHCVVSQHTSRVFPRDRTPPLHKAPPDTTTGCAHGGVPTFD